MVKVSHTNRVQSTPSQMIGDCFCNRGLLCNAEDLLSRHRSLWTGNIFGQDAQMNTSAFFARPERVVVRESAMQKRARRRLGTPTNMSECASVQINWSWPRDGRILVLAHGRHLSGNQPAMVSIFLTNQEAAFACDYHRFFHYSTALTILILIVL